jgi:hypothetical protein
MGIMWSVGTCDVLTRPVECNHHRMSPFPFSFSTIALLAAFVWIMVVLPTYMQSDASSNGQNQANGSQPQSNKTNASDKVPLRVASRPLGRKDLIVKRAWRSRARVRTIKWRASLRRRCLRSTRCTSRPGGDASCSSFQTPLRLATTSEVCNNFESLDDLLPMHIPHVDV